MDESILENLFDSRIKVKLFKIFLRNADSFFSLDEIIERTREDSSSVRYHLRKLKEIGFIESFKTRKIKVGSQDSSEIKEEIFSKERRFFTLNKNFIFINELNQVFSRTLPIKKDVIMEKLKNIGKVALVLVGGVFLNRNDARVDLFIVSDGYEDFKVNEFIRELEIDVGKEIKYAIMTRDEFTYRLDMFDNFIRSIFNDPHEILTDKIGVREMV